MEISDNNIGCICKLPNSLEYLKWNFNPIGDSVPLNNYISYQDPTFSSFDPNDKQVYPVTMQPFSNQYFEYQIRFQNTGTFPATLVIVDDLFDQNLDLSTFQMVATSHPFSLNFQNRLATWRFDNINLIHSDSNELLSHGFIKFKLKPMNNFLSGIIPNTATIYFDYNDPIVTNTSIAQIFDFTTISNSQNLSISIFPNPTSGLIKIESDQNLGDKLVKF